MDIGYIILIIILLVVWISSLTKNARLRAEMDNEKQSDNKSPMLTFNELELCDEETTRVKVRVWAELSEGCLKISGQDFGAAVEDFFGEDEYEYSYMFDLENTEHLFALLSPKKQNIKEILLLEFGGIDGCRKLKEFCAANNIKYDFFSC